MDGFEIVFVATTLLFLVEKNFNCVSFLLSGGIFRLIGKAVVEQGKEWNTVIAVPMWVLAVFNAVSLLQRLTKLTRSTIKSNVFLVLNCCLML